MSKAISRFEFNKNDYAEGTHLLQEYEYKGYFIREFEQEPCDRWKKAMEDENGYELIVGGEMGECGYEILNSTGEIVRLATLKTKLIGLCMKLLRKN